MTDCPAQPDVSERVEAGAIRSVSAVVRFAVVAITFLALDLWTKSWVFTNLRFDEVRPILGGMVDVRRSLNAGAVFGSFPGQTGLFIGVSVLALLFVVYMFCCSAVRQRALQIALAMIFAGAAGNLYDRWFVRADVVTVTMPNGRAQPIIGVILEDPNPEDVVIGSWNEGINPQRYRRSEVDIREQGVVRDFIKFVPRLPKWVPVLGGQDAWPWVFNIADAALVCGVILLFISHWIDRPAPGRR